MSRLFYPAAGAATAAGALVVAWVAAGHLAIHAQGNPLALAMTLLIGAFYAWGVLELWRFHQATLGLQRAMAALSAPAAPGSLAEWLTRVPASLRPAVRLRVEDERGVLPGPALTPYLAGLLVLLGMLGTFLGMVLTLNGTGLALERASDVQTMRDSLAAPVRGLGLAFGTSVAGVAASAMLGLVSALCRRGRATAAMALDGHVAASLRPFTRAHQQHEQQRQEQQQRWAEQQRLQQGVFALQQQQAEQLPLLVAGLQGLATSVGQSLQHSLDEGARLAAAALAPLQPAVAAAMSGITRETALLHGRIAATVQQQLDGMAQGFEARATSWLDQAAAQAQAQTTAVLQGLAEAQARQQAQQNAVDEARLAHFTTALSEMATRLEHNNAHLSDQLAAQAERTLTEVARLAHTAGEAPRAAAEVVARLREQLSASLAQDTALLEERSRIMATLQTLLGAVQHTSTAQKAAIDELVASSAQGLREAAARFTEKADAETTRLEAVSAQLTASAVDVASLGEAFGGAMQDFGHSSQALLAHLQRLDETLARSSTRSDEQLAYYVAQARELIDLSLLSQKQIVDDLQRLAHRAPAQAPEGAEA